MSRIIIELSDTSEIIIAEIIAFIIILTIGQIVYKINNMWRDRLRPRRFDDQSYNQRNNNIFNYYIPNKVLYLLKFN